MQAAFLVILAVFFAFSSARAGFFDKLKKKAEEVSSKSKKKRWSKKKRTPEAVAAARGLNEDSKKGTGRSEDERDYETLEWLESLEVTDDDVNRFIKEGRLAP